MQSHVVADLEERMGASIERRTAFASLASRVYDVTLDDGRRVVVKVPRVEQGTLSEPRLMGLVERQTNVPVPEVLAVREAIDPSYFVMAYSAGETVDSIEALTEGERLRLADEVGGVLGALHELDVPIATFGRIRADEAGELHTIEEFRTWRPRFADLMSVNVDALESLRLGDLAPRLREQFDDAMAEIPDVEAPRLNYFDCKPENLVLSRDESGPLVRAVLDWEGLSTTHWAFTLAFAERNLVEWPGAAAAGERDRLRERLYSAYADSRGWEGLRLGGWYDTYRLATYTLVAASPYWLAERDDWDARKATRLRRRIAALTDE